MGKLAYYSTEMLDSVTLHRQQQHQRLEVAGLVASGMKREEAAELVGIAPELLGELPGVYPYMPTPEMIRAQCERFRESWPVSRLRQYADVPEEWTAPICKTSDVWAAMRDAG